MTQDITHRAEHGDLADRSGLGEYQPRYIRPYNRPREMRRDRVGGQTLKGTMGLQTGQIIEGKYSILRLLGEGGMGSVYEGENVRIHRKVAIKVLHAGIAENVDAVARFEREAQAAGRIGSDHIVQVLDLGNLPGGDRFMVMEYLEGQSLSQRIQSRGRLTPEQAIPLMTQLLEGLGAAHRAGIIHRDLKPDNIYLVPHKKGHGDFVKILDFGISKFNKVSGEGGAGSNMSMTRTGAVMGTPYYMSPEQAKGSRDMDHRSDLYSAGVILYEAITGRVPFNAETFNELIFKIVLEIPAPPEQHVPGLDPAFSALIRQAMAREQSARFQTAQEFAEALQAWSGGSYHAPEMAVVEPRPTQASAPVLGQTPPPWAHGGSPTPGQGVVVAPSRKKSKLIGTVLVPVAVLAVITVAAIKLLDRPEPSEGSHAAALVNPPAAAPALPKVDPVEPAAPSEPATPVDPPHAASQANPGGALPGPPGPPFGHGRPCSQEGAAHRRQAPGGERTGPHRAPSAFGHRPPDRAGP